MKKINILFATLLLVTISCSKFLDVKPVGKLIPTEIKQFDNLLYSEQTIDYHLVCDNNFGSVLTSLSDHVYFDDLVIKYFYNPSIVLLPRMAGYAFQTPYINFNKGDNAFSNGCYKAVGIFNNAIDGVIGLGKEDDLYGKEVIAQAKVGRAWSLFVTGMSYGAGYDPHGDNSSRTIPYRTDGDPTRPNPDRATVEELYQNVQNDLEYAIENAPMMTTNPVRANRATANALMAFMYMNKGDYEKMYTYAKTAWEMQLKNYGGSASSLIYNYNDFKYEDKKPLPIVPDGVDVETKLKLETPDNMHLKSYHKENLLYRKPIKAGFSIRPSVEYLNLFSDGDLRKKLFLLHVEGFTKKIPGGGTDGKDLTVNEGIVTQYVKDDKMLGSQGMTHPELLLMLAESAARTLRTGEAMSALRLLRTYRYTPATTPIGDLTGDALIQEILNERSRELPLWSAHRFWDLKRLAREDGKPWAKKRISRVVMGETLTAEINSPKFQLEIVNSFRVDNPHWKMPLLEGEWSPYKW